MSRLTTPCTRYGQALVATMEETQHIAAKDIAHVLHPRDARAVGLHGPVGHMEAGIYNRLFVLLGRMQITFGGHGHQDQIISDAHLLALRALLARRMNRPPTSLSLAVLLQAHVEGQLVVRRGGGQTCQVLQSVRLLDLFLLAKWKRSSTHHITVVVTQQNGIAIEQCPVSRSGAFALGICGKAIKKLLALSADSWF